MTFLSKINKNSYFIRAKQWISRLGAILLLGSIPKLRIAANAGTHHIQVPKGLDWEAVDANGVRCEWITPSKMSLYIGDHDLDNPYIYNIIGAKPMTVPVWLAKLVTFFRWRFLDSPTHPSWVQATLIDSTASNAKLKSAGWIPHYHSTEAIRTAL